MMLTPEEEFRLENTFEVIGTEQLNAGNWEVVEFRWLAKKLREVNEELKARDIWCIHNCK